MVFLYCGYFGLLGSGFVWCIKSVSDLCMVETLDLGERNLGNNTDVSCCQCFISLYGEVLEGVTSPLF